MAEFAHNNAKNTSTSHTLFKLNCGYHSRIFFEKDIDLRLRSHSANKLAEEQKKLIEFCCENLFHTQELQKRTYDKEVKSRSYTLNKKVWLNSKYIKTKKNKKLKSKFFEPFHIFYTVGTQAYKLELPIK